MKKLLLALLITVAVLALAGLLFFLLTAGDDKMDVAFYVPNDSADGFDVRDSCVPVDDAQSIIDTLISLKALPEGIKVNSMSVSSSGGVKTVTLDLSGEFQQALLDQGTAGETMRLYSVVNTFLGAFRAQQMIITVDGEALETGHSIYDQPLEKYS